MVRRQILVLTAVLLVAASSSTVSAGVADGLAQPYLHIQLALANDSMDGVTEAAHVIVTESDAIGEVAVSIGTAARAVAGAMDISTARAAFGPLSDALIAYLKRRNLGQTQHRMLAGRVGCAVQYRNLSVDRRDINDAPPTSLKHVC